MEQFVIQSRTSSCRKREGGVEKALKQDIIAFYHSDYRGVVTGAYQVPLRILFARLRTILRHTQNKPLSTLQKG